jgi:hypothetical protein
LNVITTLQAYIDTFKSKDFGYLPPTLCMMGVATQMNKNARARVRDVLPHTRQVEWHPDDRTAMTPQIQGYNIPQVF